MELSNRFKIWWWGALLLTFTVFLGFRTRDLAAGHATGLDMVAFVVWLALLLAPLFNEVSLLGIKLKQRLEELKGEVSHLRNDVRNIVDVRTTVNNMLTPVSDSQLPLLEGPIKAAIANAFAEYGIKQQVPTSQELVVGEDVTLLFSVRYNVEKELRRLAMRAELGFLILPDGRLRPASIGQIITRLTETQRLDVRLASAVREVYAVCSPAIHGDPVTSAQLAFAKDTGPQLVLALQAIP